jgi:uncharacterized damage-inducible protein DinB
MSTTLLHQYLRWLDWEQTVTQQTIASLRSVPAENHNSDAWRRACSILGHLLAARQIWLFRLGAFETKPTSLFPAGLDLAQLQQDYDAVIAAWQSYLSSIADDSALDRGMEYESFDGARFRSSLADILAQVNTHGAYHRGQIAMLVKQSGGAPATTDFIYWSREKLT